eukprot:1018373-Pelagomonas_calceolata.AAC.2
MSTVGGQVSRCCAGLQPPAAACAFFQWRGAQACVCACSFRSDLHGFNVRVFCWWADVLAPVEGQLGLQPSSATCAACEAACLIALHEAEACLKIQIRRVPLNSCSTIQFQEMLARFEGWRQHSSLFNGPQAPVANQRASTCAHFLLLLTSLGHPPPRIWLPMPQQSTHCQLKMLVGPRAVAGQSARFCK